MATTFRTGGNRRPSLPLEFTELRERLGMLHDICETPHVLRRLFRDHLVAAGAGDGGGALVQLPCLSAPMPSGALAGTSPLDLLAACTLGEAGFTRRCLVVGSGSSWHAGLLAEYFLESIAKVPVEVRYASEARHASLLINDGDVVIIISRSGETSDCVECLRVARSLASRVLVLGILNNSDSTLGRECDVVLEACGTIEAGVASTNNFSGTVLASLFLALAVAERRCLLDDVERTELRARLLELPGLLEEIIAREVTPPPTTPDGCVVPEEHTTARLWDVACQSVLAGGFIFLGRGFNFPIALEGAMKMKEIVSLHAEGYPAAEMKHGPIALIDQFMPVIFIAPRVDSTYEKIKANINEVKSRNGAIIVLTEADNMELDELCLEVIRIPVTHEYLMPLVTLLFLQLLAYMMGHIRGNTVDTPAKLQKTVMCSAGDGGFAAGSAIAGDVAAGMGGVS
eukprot:NODE_5789_length_1734_cov_25.319851.p1 GENE.NODE_5789_length_1734_cov_25.319851~~NODE_5789_length_1734_cov_25.319851.p1  ORF type:complete len:457 (+),score=118.21 NODE_5789_length_1734_cov_25.319851:101-1471(+)